MKGGVRVNNCVPKESMAESIPADHYMIWEVTFDDGSKGKLRSTSDELSLDDIKAFYAKRGKTVVDATTDWGVYPHEDK